MYNPDKLTEYEQANVLNYIGFVYYNMDDIGNAIRTYERMLAIPTLEEQMAKQTTFTLSQLLTMQEQYAKALSTINKWFAMESNPAPEPFILKAQILYNLDRYAEMVAPIENAMEVARKRSKPVKEDWYNLLNFAYFQQEDYRKVRDIQKILLENWPKARYWKSLAGAFTELGEDEKLIYAYDAAHTQGMLEKDTEFVTMAQLYLQAEVPYKAGKLLQEKMDAGIVPKNEKNYRLLSQSWTRIRSRPGSSPPQRSSRPTPRTTWGSGPAAPISAAPRTPGMAHSSPRRDLMNCAPEAGSTIREASPACVLKPRR